VDAVDRTFREQVHGRFERVGLLFDTEVRFGPRRTVQGAAVRVFRAVVFDRPVRVRHKLPVSQREVFQSRGARRGRLARKTFAGHPRTRPSAVLVQRERRREVRAAELREVDSIVLQRVRNELSALRDILLLSVEKHQMSDFGRRLVLHVCRGLGDVVRREHVRLDVRMFRRRERARRVARHVRRGHGQVDRRQDVGAVVGKEQAGSRVQAVQPDVEQGRVRRLERHAELRHLRFRRVVRPSRRGRRRREPELSRPRARVRGGAERQEDDRAGNGRRPRVRVPRSARRVRVLLPRVQVAVRRGRRQRRGHRPGAVRRRGHATLREQLHGTRRDRAADRAPFHQVAGARAVRGTLQDRQVSERRRDGRRPRRRFVDRGREQRHVRPDQRRRMDETAHPEDRPANISVRGPTAGARCSGRGRVYFRERAEHTTRLKTALRSSCSSRSRDL